MREREGERAWGLANHHSAQTIATRLQGLSFGPSYLVTVVGHELAGVDQTSWKSHWSYRFRSRVNWLSCLGVG